MQFPLDAPCDYVTAVPTKDGKCAIFVFGGQSTEQAPLESIMQVPRARDSLKSDHVRYMVATVNSNMLEVKGTVRDFLKGEGMTDSILTQRAIQLPDKSKIGWKSDKDYVRAIQLMPTRPKVPSRGVKFGQNTLSEDAVKAKAEDYVQRAQDLYDHLIPAADHQRERAEFKKNGCLWQIIERPATKDIQPYVKVLVNQSKSHNVRVKGAKVVNTVNTMELCSPGPVSIGAVVMNGHQDRLKAGGDKNTVAMQVIPSRCATANRVQVAKSTLTRILNFANLQENDTLTIQALITDIDGFFNQVCMGGGGINESCYDLLDSPVSKPHPAESDYTEHGPIRYMSDIIAVRMGDMAFNTPEGLQIPCKLVFMTPSQADTFLYKPGQFRSGLYADVDHSLHNISNGKVPVRILAHDLNSRPVVSRGNVTSIDARSFRCAFDPKKSVVSGRGPVTMAIYTPNGHPPTMRNSKLSATNDYICGVFDGVPYVQIDERHDNAIARSTGKPETELWTTQLSTTEYALKQAHDDMCKLADVQLDSKVPFYPDNDDSVGVIGIKQRYSAATDSIQKLVKMGTECAGVEYSDCAATTLNALRQFSDVNKTPLQVAMAHKTMQLLERSERMNRLWTDDHPTSALPTVARIEPFKLNPTSDAICQVEEFKCIGARDTCYTVNGRAIVLAKYKDPLNNGLVDATVLFVKRTTGCDPDRRSTKLDSTELIRNSSVRCALGQAHNDDFVLEDVYENPINGTCKVDTFSGGRVDTNQWITLNVHWRESSSSPVKQNLLTFCAANCFRSNDGMEKSRIVTQETPSGLRSKFNSNWGLRLLR